MTRTKKQSTEAAVRETRRKTRRVRRQIFSDIWTVPSVRPNDKAPEVLTTPGASFLGSGGGALRTLLHGARCTIIVAHCLSKLSNSRRFDFEKWAMMLS
jgi:hypothetical protein